MKKGKPIEGAPKFTPCKAKRYMADAKFKQKIRLEMERVRSMDIGENIEEAEAREAQPLTVDQPVWQDFKCFDIKSRNQSLRKSLKESTAKLQVLSGKSQLNETLKPSTFNLTRNIPLRSRSNSKQEQLFSLRRQR